MFSTWLTAQIFARSCRFELCRSELGMSDFELAQCAANSFLYSSAPESIKRAGLAAVEQWQTAVAGGGDVSGHPNI